MGHYFDNYNANWIFGMFYVSLNKPKCSDSRFSHKQSELIISSRSFIFSIIRVLHVASEVFSYYKTLEPFAHFKYTFRVSNNFGWILPIEEQTVFVVRDMQSDYQLFSYFNIFMNKAEPILMAPVSVDFMIQWNLDSTNLIQISNIHYFQTNRFCCFLGEYHQYFILDTFFFSYFCNSDIMLIRFAWDHFEIVFPRMLDFKNELICDKTGNIFMLLELEFSLSLVQCWRGQLIWKCSDFPFRMSHFLEIFGS